MSATQRWLELLIYGDGILLVNQRLQKGDPLPQESVVDLFTPSNNPLKTATKPLIIEPTKI